MIDYDLCIIGGGINGAGIARDAAGRGLSVLLIEQGDLAGATSSASTKLIHGGLRYLEYGEFGLVRHALREREVLLDIAPHVIKPMEFILPHESHLRPAWMIRTGLFFYDHLARRDRLPGSKSVALSGGPLADTYKKGFSYADCRVDDARLVVLNAVDAAARGANIMTRTACAKIEPAGDLWRIHLNGHQPVTARMVVNATGPWVRRFLEGAGLAVGTPGIRLVKGSHIVVPRLYDAAHAYILQQPDRRIVFVIPYEDKFSLVGTTETAYQGDPAAPHIDGVEIEYLCAAVNRSFKKKIAATDVKWSYSGVRPLLDDGHDSATAVTRDYRLVLDKSHGPPLLSVFGGKITTYRYLAEEAVNQLTGKPAWTAGAKLPGGDFADFEAFCREKTVQYPALPAALVRRCAAAYGTRMGNFLGKDMGRHFGDSLCEAEVRYLIDHEWARTADDILWRRSKLGLHAGPDTVKNLEAFLQ